MGNHSWRRRSSFLRLLVPACLAFFPPVGLSWSAPAVIYRGTIPLKHWEYEDHLTQVPPSDKYYPYHRLDQWPTSGTVRDYPTVELENDCIKVTVLPWNGGHVLRFINKTTGNNQYYLNPEGFKVAHGGRLGWWLVPGGTEWMVPFDEHAPTFYQPFDDYTGPDAEPDGIRIEDLVDGVRLTMAFDEASWSAELGTPITRWRTEIQIEVPDDAALYREHIRVTNHSSQTHDLMFWENTQLCPGPGNMIITPGSEQNLNIQLAFPGNVHHMYDHNAMEPWLAGEAPWGRFSWERHSNTQNSHPQKWISNPTVIQAANVNLSHLWNWYEEGLNAAGMFIPARRAAAFAGVYNLDADEGVAKTFPQTIVTDPWPIETGTKMWNFGVYGAAAAYGFSDGTNVFIELMGGPCRVFEESGVYPHPTGEADRISVAGGSELSWTNTFSAPHGIGGFTFAEEQVVLNLEAPPAAFAGDRFEVDLGVFTTEPQLGGQVIVWISGYTLLSVRNMDTSPGASPGPFRYSGELQLRNDMPARTHEMNLGYRFPDGRLVSCSQPFTVGATGGMHEGFDFMPVWSDSLISTTGPPAVWSTPVGGYSGQCLTAYGTEEGVDNRILILPIRPGFEGSLQLWSRCASGSGDRYWARASVRLAESRDEICGAGMADPGAGWQDIVAFRWDGQDGNNYTWTQYSVPVTAGPTHRYLAIGFELGSSGTARPHVGWDEVVVTGAGAPSLWRIY